MAAGHATRYAVSLLSSSLGEDVVMGGQGGGGVEDQKVVGEGVDGGGGRK